LIAKFCDKTRACQEFKHRPSRCIFSHVFTP
jgi:hypothetical protein